MEHFIDAPLTDGRIKAKGHSLSSSLSHHIGAVLRPCMSPLQLSQESLLSSEAGCASYCVRSPLSTGGWTVLINLCFPPMSATWNPICSEIKFPNLHHCLFIFSGSFVVPKPLLVLFYNGVQGNKWAKFCFFLTPTDSA